MPAAARRLIFGLLFFIGPAILFAQESWITQLGPRSDYDPSGFSVWQVAPGSDCWFATVAELNVPPLDGINFSGLVCLNKHGNLKWMLAPPAGSGAQTVIPLRNGHVLFVTVEYPVQSCTYGYDTNTTFFEVDCDANVTPRGIFGAFFDLNYYGNPSAIEMRSGDILINSVGWLVDIKSDFSSFAWSRHIHMEGLPVYEAPGISFGFIENDDGTLTVAGIYAPEAGQNVDWPRAYIVKLDQDGALLWQRAFNLDPGFNQLTINSIVRSSDGGYWLAGFVLPRGYDPVAKTYVAKATETGEILFQKVYEAPGYPGGFINQGLSSETGGLVVVGILDEPGTTCGEGFIMGLDETGEPLWVNKALGSYCAPFTQAFSDEGGYLIRQRLDLYSPALLLKSGPQGEFGGSCAALFEHPDVTATEMDLLTPSSEVLVSESINIFGDFCPPGPSPLVKSDLVGSAAICGDVYPGILSVSWSKHGKLTVCAENYQDGAQVFINGTPSPKTLFDSWLDPAGAKLIAKGRGLKAMLPKGRAVCITVKNPDGHVSDGFPFTR